MYPYTVCAASSIHGGFDAFLYPYCMRGYDTFLYPYCMSGFDAIIYCISIITCKLSIQQLVILSITVNTEIETVL